MHTLLLTLTGLILLSAFVFVAAALSKGKDSRKGDAAFLFICLWLIVSIVDFCVGVFMAGYSAVSELGVHLIIFGVPAAVAWYLARKFKSRG
jgi:hypothetical protein